MDGFIENFIENALLTRTPGLLVGQPGLPYLSIGRPFGEGKGQNSFQQTLKTTLKNTVKNAPTKTSSQGKRLKLKWGRCRANI
jgi:1,4-alpha-glucan branching enzyme